MAGKVAVVTGGGSGIGRAAARIFAREGAKVAVAEIDRALGASSAADAGADALFVHTDVTDEASVQALMRATVEKFGRVDVLFNCAGGSVKDDKRVADVDMAIWDHTIGLDLKGPFLCCRHAVPIMVGQGGGVIVNVSSIVALRGNFVAHVYTTAKGGVISFTRALAGAYSRKGIRANAICPGVIMTDRVKARIEMTADRPNAGGLEVGGRYPFGTGEAEDIANVALFLASDESRMVNGAVIPADGGMSAY
ncbi:MAG: SDR family oxidoreductase [Rhodospirillales bacterium]|nr:SDR family oxidoreductase [Rhodospirillales bacterium]